MSRVAITVSCDVTKLTRNLKSLPAILSGKDPRFPRIRNLFWSVFMREMFRRIHHSFRVRSRGETDDLGNTWHSLERRTIKAKKREHSRFGEWVGPAPHPHFINRDTESLFRSLAMGLLSGSHYQARENQIAERNGTTLNLGTTVPYASYVDELRNLIPEDITPWVTQSLSVAIEAIAPHLAELKD